MFGGGEGMPPGFGGPPGMEGGMPPGMGLPPGMFGGMGGMPPGMGLPPHMHVPLLPTDDLPDGPPAVSEE
eukprot:3311425-Rhodomonas_salina.1